MTLTAPGCSDRPRRTRTARPDRSSTRRRTHGRPELPARGGANRDIAAAPGRAGHRGGPAMLPQSRACVSSSAFRAASATGELWVNRAQRGRPSRSARTSPTSTAHHRLGQVRREVFLVLCRARQDEDEVQDDEDPVGRRLRSACVPCSRGRSSGGSTGRTSAMGAGLEGNPQHDPVYLANDMAIRMLPWALRAGPGRSSWPEHPG